MVGVVVVVVVCAAVQVGWRGVPRRNWPGGGSGTDPSGGIASPVRGRTRPRGFSNPSGIFVSGADCGQ